jgi:hypothetical protein
MPHGHQKSKFLRRTLFRVTVNKSSLERDLLLELISSGVILMGQVTPLLERENTSPRDPFGEELRPRAPLQTRTHAPASMLPAAVTVDE